MSAFNINTYYGCETCEATNEYDNSCKHGLLLPVLLVIANKREYPKYRFQRKE